LPGGTSSLPETKPSWSWETYKKPTLICKPRSLVHHAPRSARKEKKRKEKKRKEKKRKERTRKEKKRKEKKRKEKTRPD